MREAKGFSTLELLLTGIVVMLLLVIIVDKYREAAQVERRVLAQQALITAAALQEHWFAKRYEYARSIDQLGGGDSAGEDYLLRVTFEPCGTDKCYTIWARAVNRQTADLTCRQFGIDSMGVRFARDDSDRDTTAECWAGV